MSSSSTNGSQHTQVSAKIDTNSLTSGGGTLDRGLHRDMHDTAGHDRPLNVHDLDQTPSEKLRTLVTQRDTEIQRKQEEIEQLRKHNEYLLHRLREAEAKLWNGSASHSGEANNKNQSRTEFNKFERHSSAPKSFEDRLRHEIEFYRSKLGESNPFAASDTHEKGLEDYPITRNLLEYDTYFSAVKGIPRKQKQSSKPTMINKHVDRWQTGDMCAAYSTLSSSENKSCYKTKEELHYEVMQRLKHERDRLYEHLKNIDKSEYKEAVTKSRLFLRNSDPISRESPQREDANSCITPASRKASYERFLERSQKFQENSHRLTY